MNYFELVRYMVSERGDKFGKAVKSVVFSFRPREARIMLHREFRGLLHPARLRLIDELLRYRHRRLIDICNGVRV